MPEHWRDALKGTHTETQVHAYQLNPGDEFHNPETGLLHWTAIAEVDWHGDAVRVDVQYGDGGRGAREWLSHQDLTVWRPK